MCTSKQLSPIHGCLIEPINAWQCLMSTSVQVIACYPDTTKLTGPRTLADIRWVGPVKLLCTIMFEKKAIRQAKSQYYQDQFEKNRSNIRRVWSTIKDILNKHKRKSDFPPHFIVNNRKISDAKQIADHFNIFFASVGTNLSKNITQPEGLKISKYLTQRIACSFNFDCISVSAVKKIIQDLASKNSCGVDNISTNFLKKISHVIASGLTQIVNQSLCTGIFPTKMKTAKIVPLYKKGEAYSLDNYRPISLLSSLSKVFEKVVFNQLYNYFTCNKLFYSSQYGFRQLHSTELASLELVDRITKYIDEGKLPLSVFLDLSKAFDTIDHRILLQKLKYYGVSDTPLKWLRSYLSDRKQCVYYEGVFSDELSVCTGVPQGSILGPLLFIIYMNDIYEASDKFQLILYADDTNMVAPLCSFSPDMALKNITTKQLSCNINKELNQIQDWLLVNKLTLNVDKTKFMIFHNRQRKVEGLIPKLKINCKEIERVSTFNFLGLTIDENVNWHAHTLKIANRISRTLGIMNRIKNFVPAHVLRIIYNSLILPHLQYSLLAWGFYADRLFKLQKRAMRIITNSKYNAHTEPLFKKLNLLQLRDLFTLNIVKLFYKIKTKTLPEYFQEMFPAANPTPYELRATPLLQETAVRSETGKKCIRYHLPNIINKMDPSLLELCERLSYRGFADATKRSLINKYSTACAQRNCYICKNTA